MVYHCTVDSDSCRSVGSCPIVPLRTKSKGPASATGGPDIVDEAVEFFRANVLFRSFEVLGATDKLLLYLTLYISACLKRLVEDKVEVQHASSLLFRMAHEPFRIPGDSDFVLGGLLGVPKTKEEEDMVRAYLRQCREEVGNRLLKCCFTADGLQNKFWMAYAQRRFLNKSL